MYGVLGGEETNESPISEFRTNWDIGSATARGQYINFIADKVELENVAGGDNPIKK